MESYLIKSLKTELLRLAGGCRLKVFIYTRKDVNAIATLLGNACIREILNSLLDL